MPIDSPEYPAVDPIGDEWYKQQRAKLQSPVGGTSSNAPTQKVSTLVAYGADVSPEEEARYFRRGDNRANQEHWRRFAGGPNTKRDPLGNSNKAYKRGYEGWVGHGQLDVHDYSFPHDDFNYRNDQINAGRRFLRSKQGSAELVPSAEAFENTKVGQTGRLAKYDQIRFSPRAGRYLPMIGGLTAGALWASGALSPAEAASMFMPPGVDDLVAPAQAGAGSDLASQIPSSAHRLNAPVSNAPVNPWRKWHGRTY